MDILVRKFVENFANDFGFAEDSIDKQFEKYIAWTYLQKYNDFTAKSIEDVNSGGGDDLGIDIAAVLVNNFLVTDPSEITEHISDKHKNSIKLVLFQAKTSKNYDAKLISKFLHGVETIAQVISKEGHDLPDDISPQLINVIEILKQSLDLITSFETFNIPVELYYVTTAPHEKQDALKDSQVTSALDRIKNIGIFQSNISVSLHGKNKIQETKENLKGPKDIIIHFPKKQVIPATQGVEQAFIGVITASEIIKLVSDNNILRESIFDDNVRLYQGEENDVNKKIKATLDSPEKFKFPLLNNGITLVTRSLEHNGENLKLSHYSIINGCQTSNEIFNWWQDNKENSEAENIAKEIYIPLKIIETTSDEIQSEITVATNRQTAIKDSDIQSSNKVAKQVELYFQQTGRDGMRFQRQTVEAKDYDVAKLRIIDYQTLNRAVASAVFGDSALASNSPTQLGRKQVYMWKDYPESIYYFAAKSIYQIDRHIVNNNHSNIKAAKWHIASLAARLTFNELAEITPLKTDSGFPKEYAKKLKSVGEKINNSPAWVSRLDSSISTAVQIVRDEFEEKLSESNNLVKDDVRSLRVQENLLKRLNDHMNKS